MVKSNLHPFTVTYEMHVVRKAKVIVYATSEDEAKDAAPQEANLLETDWFSSGRAEEFTGGLDCRPATPEEVKRLRAV